MKEPILKELTTPLARELGEYTLLKNDIEESFRVMKLWFEKYAGRKKHELTKEEELIALSLFRNAVIMFVGCFDESAEVSLSASAIYGSKVGGMEFFKWLKDIRDSYAAHKFGPLRQCPVGVLMDETGNILGGGHQIQIYAGPVASSKELILSFISVAGRFIERKVAELATQLLQDAKKMSAVELAALKAARVYDVPPHQYRTSREAFLRSLRDGDKG